MSQMKILFDQSIHKALKDSYRLDKIQDDKSAFNSYHLFEHRDILLHQRYSTADATKTWNIYEIGKMLTAKREEEYLTVTGSKITILYFKQDNLAISTP